jgi:hypothetical protein
MTKFTSTKAEHICEKFVCKADTRFAFKAFQKENPFVIFGVIFIFTCICCGLSIRIFEPLYWETKKDNPYFQDWDYMVNAYWFTFVSMCTVGYGDFYAKTQIGRFITILACLIGTYFTSMMMVFMTQKSNLNENEKKTYLLISRLKYRYEIKQHNAYMIYNYLKMIRIKFKKSHNEVSEKEYQIKFNYEKRNIFNLIEIIKSKEKIINTFGLINFKEKLLNISQRIDSDIREMKEEVESLKFINETLISFSNCQVDIIKDLKKNCYSNRLFYYIIKESKKYKSMIL